MTHHVILGAGPAGVIAAETIRKHAPHDRITVVGDENHDENGIYPLLRLQDDGSVVREK
jgi:NADPH-dependent 2,4-dienoyl-CoA reductase/sulfur reductase-like enzyme